MQIATREHYITLKADGAYRIKKNFKIYDS